MMHALEGTPGASLVGQQQPLEKEEKEILAANIDFFRRGAVHTLCEQVKVQSGMDPKIVSHIKWKYNLFLKMLASPDASPPKEVWDPVVQYGFDRIHDAELIKKLRSQYLNATMACYELGYIQQCSEWKHYTEFPEYWFKVYEQRLLSEEHMKKWSALSVDSTNLDKDHIKGKDQVRIWLNKLSLLKHVAQRLGKDGPNLDIDHISDTLIAKLHEQAAYSQLVNDDLVKESTRVSNTTPLRFRTLILV